MTTCESFSKWRGRLWPIHNYELKKILPLWFIKFFISFNYAILFAAKDTLIVTTAGAEAIPILKGWVVLFAAFGAILIYSKLSNHLSQTKLFYTTLLPFLIFFPIYAFFLYPNREMLSFHESADFLLSIVGKEHAHWVSLYRYWMHSLFFVMAELWGAMVIQVLFWGFANQINKKEEAGRFYSIFSTGGNLATMLAGQTIWYLSNAFGKNRFDLSLKCLLSVSFAITLTVLIIFYIINRYLLNDEKLYSKETNAAAKKQKTKLPLLQSLKCIFKSRYLGYIALMVIGYGLSVNMVEVAWKALLKLKFPDPGDFQAFMGRLQSIIGLFAMLMAFFAGGNVIRKFGWLISAQFTPIILGFFSLLFFGLCLFQKNLALIAGGPLTILVLIGTLHNISCKSMKYVFFDPTKEMAYIPMDQETKVKGKAAVDVVAARFGKSGSSWIQTGMIEFIGSGSILGVVNLLLPCVTIAVVSWMIAIFSLHKKMVEAELEQNG